MVRRAGPDPLGDEDRSIGDMIADVLDDGRAYAQAEIELAKVRVESEVNRYRRAAIFAAAGMVVALAAVVAFAMTTILGFSYLVGPFWGGMAAIGALGLTTYILFSLARGAVEDRPGAASEDDIDTYD